MSPAVAALLLLTAVIWGKAEAFSDDAMDCCLGTSSVLVPRHIVANYIVQNIDSGCPIPATLFITKKQKKLCSPPAEDTAYPWVAKLIVYLDKKKVQSSKQ